jgi:hypothetical protein
MADDPHEQLEFYRSLLIELQKANADIEGGLFRVLKQETGGATQDITDEALRTNKISVILLQGTIRMLEKR